MLPPHFFVKRIRLNLNEYIKLMKDFVDPWAMTILTTKTPAMEMNCRYFNCRVQDKFADLKVKIYWIS